jgi:hypothetical protein
MAAREVAMSDEELRDLVRRWRESNSVEDCAACLRARLRSGQLTDRRLELAAYCGSEAAALALHKQVTEAPQLMTFIREVANWEEDAPIMAALAAARTALEYRERSIGRSMTVPRRLLEAAELFSRHRNKLSRDAVAMHMQATESLGPAISNPDRKSEPAWEASLCAALGALYKKQRELGALLQAMNLALTVVSEDVLSPSVRTSVSSWALE